MEDDYYDDYSLTGDEALDYLIYQDITDGHDGTGCLTLLLILVSLIGVTIV
jgi:hypothetical protein